MQYNFYITFYCVYTAQDYTFFLICLLTLSYTLSCMELTNRTNIELHIEYHAPNCIPFILKPSVTLEIDNLQHDLEINNIYFYQKTAFKPHPDNQLKIICPHIQQFTTPHIVPLFIPTPIPDLNPFIGSSSWQPRSYFRR